MTLRWPYIVLFSISASGCTVFSPYIPSAKIERELASCKPVVTIDSTKTEVDKKLVSRTTTTTEHKCNTSTKNLSLTLQEEFQASATSLSRASNTTVLTIASLLGFGAYKGITDGGKSQIAALGAGAGTLYGLHSTMYTPTREQLYQRAVKSLICLDDLYADIDPAKGESLAKRYKTLPKWAYYQDRYDSAYELAVMHENSYRSRVMQAAADLNILLSNGQPSAAESYARVSSAIKTKIADIAPQDEKNLLLLLVPERDFPDLARWVARTEIASKKINLNNPDSCNLSSLPVLRVLGVDNQGTIELKKGETRTLPITNNSSVISTNIYPTGNDSDKDAVTSMLVSEGGAFAIRLEAKKITKDAIAVKLTDAGNGNVSTIFFVTVK